MVSNHHTDIALRSYLMLQCRLGHFNFQWKCPQAIKQYIYKEHLIKLIKSAEREQCVLDSTYSGHGFDRSFRLRKQCVCIFTVHSQRTTNKISCLLKRVVQFLHTFFFFLTAQNSLSNSDETNIAWDFIEEFLCRFPSLVLVMLVPRIRRKCDKDFMAYSLRYSIY